MTILDVTTNEEWNVAQNTRIIRAKPLSSIIVDAEIRTHFLSKFLVNTLEGAEPLNTQHVICLGQDGESWPQEARRLLDKYNVTDIDSEGWMVCRAKSYLTVNYFQLTLEWLEDRYRRLDDHTYIVGTWGATLPDGTKNAQRVDVGDYILRDIDNHNNIWVVRQNIFPNTYKQV